MTIPDWLLLFLTGLPLLSGAFLLAASAFPLTRGRVSERLARTVAVGAAGLAALSALLLLPYASYSPPASEAFLQVEWLPGTGPMSIAPGTTGLYAGLVTSWSAFFALLASRRRGSGGPSPLGCALTLFALAAANFAFLSQQFLGRYVALEIVALVVAFMPLVEAVGAAARRGPADLRLSTATYLILRVGDAGLLAAILILMGAGGSLDITTALEAGKALPAALLAWAVGGFLLAVWVKQGAWPFHLWLSGGRALTLGSRAWLYATVMPNLGTYLLYRITPLLALSDPLRTATMWLGAGSAIVAMLLAWAALGRSAPPDLDTGLIYLGAAQGGLALYVSAAGSGSLVWLILLAVTLPRLLLFLAADAAERTNSRLGRRAAASAFGGGALLIAVFFLLVTWWSREIGAPAGPSLLSEGAFLAAQVAVSLIVIWIARLSWRLWSGSGARSPAQSPPEPEPGSAQIGWMQRTVTGILFFCTLAGALAWRSLLTHLLSASHAPPLPAASAGHVAAFALALLVAMIVAGSIRLLGPQRQGQAVPYQSQETDPAHTDLSKRGEYRLEEGLSQIARVLRDVVEVNIQERILVTMVRVVVDGAQWAYRLMETQFLEGLLGRAVAVIVGAGQTAYHNVEQKGLEGTLRQVVVSILALNRRLQRLHTGKLRHNLIWIMFSLAVAILALILY